MKCAYLLAAVVLIAGPAYPLRHSAAAPAVRAPEDLLMVATAPSIDGAVDDLVAFADRAVVGSGAMVRGSIDSQLQQLPSIDRAAAMSIFVLDHAGASPSTGLVLAVLDAKAFTAALPAGTSARFRDKWAVIGDPATLARAGTWALARLAGAKVPPHVTATLNPATVLAAHRADLELLAKQGQAALGAAPAGSSAGAGASPALGEIFGTMVTGLIAGLEQCEQVQATLELSSERAAFALTLQPRPRTVLAAVIAAQRASDFALLARLPVTGAAMVGGGRMVLGPLGPVVWTWIERFLALPSDAPAFRASLQQLMTLGTGEVAMAMNLDPRATKMAALYRTSNARRAAKVIEDLAVALRAQGPRTVEMMGMKSRYEIVADPAPIAGIQFRQMNTSYDYSGMATPPPPAMRSSKTEALWAAWDDVIGVANPDSAAALVAASRTTAALPDAFAGFVTEARARKASFLEVIDYAGLVATMVGSSTPTTGAPLALWLGFTGGRGTLGFTVPSASVTAIMQAVSASKRATP